MVGDTSAPVQYRMESNGEPGKVLISQQTKTKLDEHFQDLFTYKKHIDVKLTNFNNEVIPSYFVSM